MLYLFLRIPSCSAGFTQDFMDHQMLINFGSMMYISGDYDKLYMNMNIVLPRFLHNHGNIATERSPKPGLCPTLILNAPRVLYNAQYHRQHCTLHAFEQFGALYVHNHDDKIFDV